MAEDYILGEDVTDLARSHPKRPDARAIRLLHVPLVPVTMMVWRPGVGFVPLHHKVVRCSCGGPWPCEGGGAAT